MMKRSYLKMLIDVVMTIAVLVLMEPKATGQSMHEWGGLLLCLLFLVHMAMNWQWVRCVTGKFFNKLPAKNRVNYVLDILLFVGFFSIVVSGIAIAKTIDFTWLPLGNAIPWRSLHISASLFTLIIAAIHVGLHWKWVNLQLKNLKKEVSHA